MVIIKKYIKLRDELIEGVDFYWEEIDGVKLRIWTKEYLQMIRVKCCENSCRHCPWNYRKEENDIS